MRSVARLLTLLSGLLLISIGGSLLLDRLGTSHGLAWLDPARRQVRAWIRLAERGGGSIPDTLPGPLGDRFEGVDPGSVIFAAGLLIVVCALVLIRRAGRGGAARGSVEAGSEWDATGPAPDRRLARRIRKQARGLEKRGEPIEAAELLWSHDLLDEAANLFIRHGAFVRAAEIRHDQNRFLESAELHLQGGNPETAASIFAQQESWSRAAECYLKSDHKSLAAEMFEKAGSVREAADCYRASELLRHAAAMYVKSHAWRSAAECLEAVFSEEGGAGGFDPKKAAEMAKLARQSGRLFLKAEDLGRAHSIFARGGCALEAGEVASLLGDHAAAAQHFRQAGAVDKAAAALRLDGQEAEAARVLGHHLRDAGQLESAAALLEEAGEWLEAGDLYRTLERYEEAARCYSSQDGFSAAAEMYALAGDRERAGAAYESAGEFARAAECFALAGQPVREAEMLERAGDLLAAGELYRREGRDDEAIAVLQKVGAEEDGFTRAAVLLGDLFVARGQTDLAMASLERSVDGASVSTGNVEAFYKLAALQSEQGRVREALALYEKVTAFDYHYGDVGARLAETRARLQDLEPMAASEGESGRTGAERRCGGAFEDDRYRIVGELGRGGMGIVYKVHDRVLDRVVAFKVLPRVFSENAQAIGNFLREAQAAAKLNHPNIVTVYDTGEHQGRYFITMEYVEGTTIKEILRRRGPIPESGLQHVLVQIAEALAYAHDKRVVHRDIKPANVMWTRDQKVKLMDFGLAKVVEEARHQTTVVAGTPYYMSPEQTLGRNVDHRTDLYSLGVSLFEMATGTVPFKEGNIPYHHVHTAPPAVRTLRPDLSEALSRIIDRCLQKDPADRHPSAAAILTDLRGVPSRRGEAQP